MEFVYKVRKRSLILLCSPAKLAAKILELRQAQHDWALKELEDGPSVSEDALLLDLYMAFKKFETDSSARGTGYQAETQYRW